MRKLITKLTLNYIESHDNYPNNSTLWKIILRIYQISIHSFTLRYYLFSYLPKYGI